MSEKVRVEELRKISEGLSIIADVEPNYRRGRMLGYSYDEIDAMTMEAVTNAENLIDELIDRALQDE